MSWFLYETLALLELAIPSALCNMLEGSMYVVDVMMLGHLGKGNVAALAMGNALFNIFWYFIEGFLTAQDTLAANAHALGDPGSVRQWSYISMLCVAILCAITTVAFFFAEPILGNFFRLPYHLKTKAAVHVYLLLPGLWFLAASRVLLKYFQAQQLLLPGLAASLAANAVNILANYLLIYAAQLGFAGCAVATTLARLTYLAVLTRALWRRPEFGVIVRELKGCGRDPAVQRGCARCWALFGGCVSTALAACSALCACCPVLRAGARRQYDYLASVEGERDEDEEGVQLVQRARVRKKDTPSKQSWQPSTPSSPGGGGGGGPDEDEEDDDDEEEEEEDDEERTAAPERAAPPAARSDGRLPSAERRRQLLLLRCLRLALLGLPGGLMLGLEGWLFVAAAAFVAQMGSVLLAAHEVRRSARIIYAFIVYTCNVYTCIHVYMYTSIHINIYTYMFMHMCLCIFRP